MASREYFEQTATSIAALGRRDESKISEADLSWILPKITSTTSA
jgi:hypothetical protein